MDFEIENEIHTDVLVTSNSRYYSKDEKKMFQRFGKKPKMNIMI